MSTSFVAALAGTVLAAVGTGLAIRLCVRKPRTDMVAWVIALAGLTAALAAQAAGYRRGFVPTTFRATQLGAALIAPLALAWGMAEVAARGLVARFAARLLLAGLFVVAGVILATDLLTSQPFSQKWPCRPGSLRVPAARSAGPGRRDRGGDRAPGAGHDRAAQPPRPRLAGRADRGRAGQRGRAGHAGTPDRAAREHRVPGPHPDRRGGRLAGRRPCGPGEPGPDPGRCRRRPAGRSPG